MTYYHVSIKHHDPSRKESQAYDLDFTKEMLETQIVNPYHEGRTFLCGGQAIDPFFIDIIKISKTDKPSNQSSTKFREEYESGLSDLGISSPASDNWLVVTYGLNVTRQFITHPPVKVKEEESVHNTNKSIFIVHGTDNQPVKELKVILEEVGIKPIVLHEQPSKGMTIIEKLEEYSDVGFAFIILTPDDFGLSKKELAKIVSEMSREKPTQDELKKYLSRLSLGQRTEIFAEAFNHCKDKARQNVVLEFGYFIGKLGRSKVCCLYKGDLELPSDMQGICYLHFDSSVREVENTIIEELKAANILI
jgi:predicted nucleotide-binding protein